MSPVERNRKCLYSKTIHYKYADIHCEITVARATPATLMSNTTTKKNMQISDRDRREEEREADTWLVRKRKQYIMQMWTWP